MDFAHVRFAVRVNHESIDLFFVFERTDHRESTICGGEGEIHQTEGVGD